MEYIAQIHKLNRNDFRSLFPDVFDSVVFEYISIIYRSGGG